jgi:hypothetical protein
MLRTDLPPFQIDPQIVRLTCTSLSFLPQRTHAPFYSALHPGVEIQWTICVVVVNVGGGMVSD